MLPVASPAQLLASQTSPSVRQNWHNKEAELGLMGLTASSPYNQSTSKLNVAFTGRAGDTSFEGEFWDVSPPSPLIYAPSELLSYLLKGRILQGDSCQTAGL